MKSNILITGGAGFIGSSLYKSLRELHNIYIVDNFNNFYAPEQKMANLSIKKIPDKNDIGGTLMNVDIRDNEMLCRLCSKLSIDAIIHCAAMPGVLPSFENPGMYYSVNTQGTLSVAECARKNGIYRMVFLSSSSVYGSNETLPFTEQMKMKPISVYADTKKCAEEILKTYSEHYDINIAVLRLFTVYGPAQRPDLALHKFCLNALNGKKSSIYGSLHSKRDYTYIDDAVSGIKAAMEYTERVKGFNVFNIASGRTVSMNEFIGKLQNAMPDFGYSIIPPMKGDMKETFGDISKARRVLNYKPCMDFKRGIDEFLAWFREYYRNNE